MATVHCSKCTAERKGFRRELDSWRHKLIHCIGFESILEGIYGPLLRDLNLFHDCEPEEVLDWSPDENCSQCSFCSLSLDKQNDQVLSSTSPLSLPPDYSPCHVPILSESSQSAHRFLQAVFHKKDVPQDCDPNIPLIAQELMKKMIRQFAMEYASKCLLHTTTNGVPGKTTSPPLETADAPLDLTVSRAQEEQEPQPDGVLDLSNRKSASLPTSKPSVSSMDHKSSGGCLSTKELGEPEHQRTTVSALDAVLSSLCPAHRSLVYRILKQQKLLILKTVKQVEPECYCCHCGQHFDNHMSHYHGAKSDCCQNGLNDHCSSRCRLEDAHSTHQMAVKASERETERDLIGSSGSSAQSCKRETCTVVCPKKVNAHSCQSLSPHPNNGVCTCRATAPPSSSVLIDPLSKCCGQRNNPACSNHLMLSSEAKSTKCAENGSSFSVLQWEHGPSPPPLSPIPSDLNKESDESSPARLSCIEDQEAKSEGKKYLGNVNLKVAVKRQKRRVTRRFSDVVQSTNPFEKAVSLAAPSMTDKQPLQGTSSSVQSSADAHLTEVITAVCHTGRASEHSSTEFMNHQKKNPEAPNTRSRYRQEVLTAMATLANDATNQRQAQKMTQKLSRQGQSYSKQKTTKLKRGKNLFAEYQSEVRKCKTAPDLAKDNERSSHNKNVQGPLEQSNNLGKPRKSKRTIVPPPRYSSYVTEPRKMYFVACFSDSIFNQRNQTDEVMTHPQRSISCGDACVSQSTAVFSLKPDSHSQAIPTTTKEKSPAQEHSSSLGKRRKSPQREEVSMPSTRSLSRKNTCVEYISPIKLMFVSPVKDEEGMKYSLKSAAVVNGSQADDSFDPCEESSWSGTPEKSTSQSTELAELNVSPLKSFGSAVKRISVSTRSSPNKTPSNKSSPEKSDSSLSPKAGSRQGESSPTKCFSTDDTLRCSQDALALHETTPPKRRPGRPKKLGPQLEKKEKRPIGRPRKEKAMQSTDNEKSDNRNAAVHEVEENVNKNLKITVLYGRSRRNKRMVSEGFDQLQTEFHDACQAVGLNNNWSMLMDTKINSTDSKIAPDELSQEIPLIKPVKACAKSNIKCQSSLDDAAPSRKPGRPAKVKISGISVTVTTVSPRQRKIQINKDKTSPVTRNHRKALFQTSATAKEPKTITPHSVSESSDVEQPLEEPKEQSKVEPTPPAAIRHSERVRKPSIHFLHAVATSGSYSRSSAIVRRSKALLLNGEQKKDDVQSAMQTSGEHLGGQPKPRTGSLGLHQISTVSVESIYSPREVKWWSASVQEKTLNQELARRIRLLSDSWVSDNTSSETGLGLNKHSSASNRKSKNSSVVRSLFDCSPNKPRSCSMQQLCSWFMQTTETQSLTVVKNANSRNSFELMHFPRNANKKSMCYSPQAERLRKHLKKFAKSVPKTPSDFKQAQKKVQGKRWASTNISDSDRLKKNTPRRSKSSSTYQAILYQAKRRFFTAKERKRWMDNKIQNSLNKHVNRLQQFPKLTKQLPSCNRPLDPVAKDVLCSKQASPDKLKECRVFLRKISSPNNGPTTDALDDGSPPLFGAKNTWATVDKTVKTDQIKSPRRACLRNSESASPKSAQAVHVEPMRRKSLSKRALSESNQPPPAKRLRQSRMMGLSGPRWRDFVFGN